MKKTIFSSIIILTLIGFMNSCSELNNNKKADTIYTNGKIYTVNETQPWAEAVAIKDGIFIKVGSTINIKPATTTRLNPVSYCLPNN